MSAPAVALPAGARELLDVPEPAVLGTLNADGSPHLCVMWVAREGDELLMSTKAHRRQYRNLQRDPRASVVLYSRPLPRRYVEIRGRAELGGAGAEQLILVLARAYTGHEHDGWSDQDERVLIRIIPEYVGLHD
jgi:PPOX class probable F420-dependent enzyme